MNFLMGGISVLEKNQCPRQLVILMIVTTVSIERNIVFWNISFECISSLSLLDLRAFHSSWSPLCDHLLTFN